MVLAGQGTYICTGGHYSKKAHSWLEEHRDMAVGLVGKRQKVEEGSLLVEGKDKEGDSAPHVVQEVAWHREESHGDGPGTADPMMVQVRTLPSA